MLQACPRLRHLSLAENRLIALPELGHMRCLQFLDLANNHIETLNGVTRAKMGIFLPPSLVYLSLLDNPVAADGEHRYVFACSALPMLLAVDGHILTDEETLQTLHPSPFCAGHPRMRLQLAFFPHCLRVAVKMPVDPGPMRESQVKLLYPPSPNPSTIFLNGYRPEDTGPGSLGWVTVIENGIEFSFDLTRVMFCSGNVTERMRAGRMVTRVQGRIVVDLYAGVGYYTLPYLCRAHAAHVHACEWNPKSIIALNHNIVANRVSPSRCTVYAADNKTTVESGVLDGIAQVV
jgi:hypothetical protein